MVGSTKCDFLMIPVLVLIYHIYAVPTAQKNGGVFPFLPIFRPQRDAVTLLSEILN